MAIGRVTIGQTPCCGVIERTYETFIVDGAMRYDPIGEIVQRTDPDTEQAYYEEYTPTFREEAKHIDSGVCPDCGKRFQA